MNISEHTKNLSQKLGLDLDYFLKGGFWIGLSLLLTTIIGITLSAIFSRAWPIDVYGQYVFLLSVVGYISLTALPGLNQVVIQEVAKGNEGVYKKAILVSLKYSLIGTLILLLGCSYFFLRENFNLSLAFLFFALFFPLSYGLNLHLSFLNGRGNFKLLSFCTILTQVIPPLLTALALVFYSSFPFVVFISTGSLGIINLILTIISLSWIKNKKYSKDSISFGIKLTLTTVISLLSDYLDRFLIPILLGFEFNAIYAFASIIPLQIHGFFKIFTSLAQPKIAKTSNRILKQTLYKKVIQLAFVVGFIVIFYILLAPTLFNYLYPNYAASALRLSQLYSLSLLYFPTNLFGVATSYAIKSAKNIFLINIIFTFITIIPLIILTPILGLTGVVIARIISRIITSMFHIYIFNKLYR